jgi:L-seryl-tRNA(Ser) seleniumtransferase
MTDFSDIPGVDSLLKLPETLDLILSYGHTLVVSEIRKELEEIRLDTRNGGSLPSMPDIIQAITINLKELDTNTTQPVINATGVILHTNLGRAPLSQAAIRAMSSTSTGYSTLEFDHESGRRSKRTTHIEHLMQQYLGVEAAFIVNNNAAAVLLVLSALACRKKVILSRNQIVEIGGGFRIPDILKQSGAHLMEIGTTNQIHLEDYRMAIHEGGSLVLHVHPSNFKIIGFVGEPTLTTITELAHENNIPIIDDLGSGALLDTAQFGLTHEPTVQESLKVGVDVVCFSGDKLFGGPQAGIIVGKKNLLEKVKKHPLARALRADKTLISALEATTLHYIKDQALEEIPVWKMISADLSDLHDRVVKWSKHLNDGEIREGQSTVGGGSLPEEILPTWILAFRVKKPDVLASILRSKKPAVIVRIQDGLVCFDPRTVLQEQEDHFLLSLSHSLQQYRQIYEKST